MTGDIFCDGLLTSVTGSSAVYESTNRPSRVRSSPISV
jgi:hypothetical protein